MTKLRLLFTILSLSIVFFSCGGSDEVEPLDVQASMLGTYTGFRLYEITLIGGGTTVASDTFNIVVTKGRDAKTMVFTETTSEFKGKAYKYEINIETEARDGATFTIAEQNFQGEPLQGEDLFSSQPGIHGVYSINEATSKESIDFTLRILNGGQASKAINYEYLFDKN